MLPTSHIAVTQQLAQKLFGDDQYVARLKRLRQHVGDEYGGKT
jgi:hypothetical protein